MTAEQFKFETEISCVWFKGYSIDRVKFFILVIFINSHKFFQVNVYFIWLLYRVAYEWY